ncbi:MAG: hypothetical protein Q7S27_05865 [Nanoarchaeota archaeon]|nr:hypothetical protein [Nanoarchaeota archaeon]
MRKDNLKKKFEKLALKWYEDTCIHSNPEIINSHPNCEKLIKMGEPIIPFILEDIKNSKYGDWGYILKTISREDPVPRHHYGFYNSMRDDWLAWGKNKGYISYTEIRVN